MKKYGFFSVFLSMLVLASHLPALSPSALPSLAPILKNVMPAVVNLQVDTKTSMQDKELRDFFQNQPFPFPFQPMLKPTRRLGSGVIVESEKGYILTNAHLVKDPKKIKVRFKNGKSANAKLVGIDNASDIALIQVQIKDLQAIKLGNSDRLEVGDFVAAIGNPFGLNQTVTAGIVSALSRNNLNIEGYENFIQTDAAINPGNSGGALINLNGELIGINTAILSSSGGSNGIGFAIPINMARSIMDQLIKYGTVKRGMLGVSVQQLTDELATAIGVKVNEGVLVASVVSHSAAEKAGLKQGDIITEVNGQSINSPAQLRNMIGLLPEGSSLKLTAIRNGKALSLQTTLTALPKESEQVVEKSETFLSSLSLTPSAEGKGLQITAITNPDLATQYPLAVNDIILSAKPGGIANSNRPMQVVSSVQKFREIVKQASNSQTPLLLEVRKSGDGSIYYVVINLEDFSATLK